MAPELEDGRSDDLSPSVDVYSLGKLLYWMLSGKTFAREKHRDSDYDLTQQSDSPAYYLIYELLDKMIVANPDDRLPDANAVLEELNSAINRIEINAHAVGAGIPQRCYYCGKGIYQVFLDGTENPRKSMASLKRFFGFEVVRSGTWVVLVCDHCGNTQIFRPDKVQGENPWEK